LTILPPDEVATDSGLTNEQQILLDPAHALTFLADLRTALKHGHENISDSRIRRLSHMFQDSHWLTWVRSEDPEGLIDPLSTAESITEMIGQSNSPTRRVVMADVPHSLNPQGLKAVLSWRSGLTAPMWFSPEGPVYRPSEFSVDNAEVVVAFGDRPTLQSGQTALWFSPSSVTEMPANITQIPVAELGFDDSGTIVRADGVALQVPSKVISRRIKTAEFLSNIRNALNLQSTTGGVSR
jgi:formylmethanofuran dehydrogenase subunit B